MQAYVQKQQGNNYRQLFEGLKKVVEVVDRIYDLSLKRISLAKLQLLHERNSESGGEGERHKASGLWRLLQRGRQEDGESRW